jgi:hypothetical protein
VTRLAQTVRYVAMALSVLFGTLAVLVASDYLRQHGGWDLESGSSDLMTIMLLVLGFVLALSVVVLRPGARTIYGVRSTSIVWTLALVLALFFTWHVIIVSNRWVNSIGTPIGSPQALEAFQAANPASFEGYDYFVPTGVLLQSFEFLNANNVEMSGFVWQEYGPEIPDHVLRGVVFPEALDEAYEAREAWRVEQDGTSAAGFGRTLTIASTRSTARISGFASGPRKPLRGCSQSRISKPIATCRRNHFLESRPSSSTADGTRCAPGSPWTSSHITSTTVLDTGSLAHRVPIFISIFRSNATSWARCSSISFWRRRLPSFSSSCSCSWITTPICRTGLG